MMFILFNLIQHIKKAHFSQVLTDSHRITICCFIGYVIKQRTKNIKIKMNKWYFFIIAIVRAELVSGQNVSTSCMIYDLIS